MYFVGTGGGIEKKFGNFLRGLFFTSDKIDDEEFGKFQCWIYFKERILGIVIEVPSFVEMK